jgi:hypothetical protein
MEIAQFTFKIQILNKKIISRSVYRSNFFDLSSDFKIFKLNQPFSSIV